MEVLLVSATPFEIAPTLAHLEQNFARHGEGVFEQKNLRVRVLVTGVGMVATAFHLGYFFARHQPNLALNVGIAGAIAPQLQIGDVLCVSTERFADLGVEEADGRFTDLFDLGLLGADTPPFQAGAMHCLQAEQSAFLPAVHGLTVNQVHGAAASIAALRQRYPDAQVESMEGAAFFYTCLLTGVPFLQIRSISNFVEPRNRAGWNLPQAIGNLNRTVLEMLDGMAGMSYEL